MAIENHDSYSCRILNYTKDGKPLWNDLVLSPVFEPRDGSIRFYTGIQIFSPYSEASAASYIEPLEQASREVAERVVEIQSSVYQVLSEPLRPPPCWTSRRRPGLAGQARS